MSLFHRRLLEQLPESWMPLMAQGVKIILSYDGWKFDFPEDVVISIPRSDDKGEAFSTLDKDACDHSGKSFQPSPDDERTHELLRHLQGQE
jgi:hypothetical protein